MLKIKPRTETGKTPLPLLNKDNNVGLNACSRGYFLIDNLSKELLLITQVELFDRRLVILSLENHKSCGSIL